jgi:uncharacterized lipoprotein YajG
MQTIALIIVLQVAVALLAGCSKFETKMESYNNELLCSPADSNMCAGWKR